MAKPSFLDTLWARAIAGAVALAASGVLQRLQVQVDAHDRADTRLPCQQRCSVRGSGTRLERGTPVAAALHVGAQIADKSPVLNKQFYQRSTNISDSSPWI